MKIVTTLFTVLFLNAFLIAQSPQKMSYQAVIRNNNNALVAGTSVGMQISILQGSVTGLAVYVEKHIATTNSNGLASIEIGSGNVISGVFSNIDWANGPYYIKTETDPLGGSSYSIIGTSQLLSVPYALHANTAETVMSGGSQFSHFVGEVFGGGVVFNVYRDATGIEHGLVVSIVDLGPTTWGLLNTVIPNSADEWDGEANTAAIVAFGGAPASAASLCDSYSHDGFTDWYLPSIREFELLYDNIYRVNKTLNTVVGGVEINTSQSSPLLPVYWTSTQQAPSHSFSFHTFLESTHINSVTKDGLYLVRAVRSY